MNVNNLKVVLQDNDDDDYDDGDDYDVCVCVFGYHNVNDCIS